MDNKGLDAKVEGTVDLAPDFPAHQLRLRTITFEPGGYQKSLGPGGIITESRAVEHWAENRDSAKVVIVGVDIIKKP